MIKIIDVTLEEMKIIKEILNKHVPEYEVRAFGSRVQARTKRASDLDLVVMTDTPLSTLRRVELKEAFQEADLSFKVDVIDWARTGEKFRKIISQEWLPISR